MEVMVESGCLGFLVIGTLVGASPMPQSLPLLGPLPEATTQSPQIIKYETKQELKGYSVSYELTDGTARKEEGNLEEGIWIVFWGAEWTDHSKAIVRIASDQTGVSWSINRVTAIAPENFMPTIPPPVTSRPHAGFSVASFSASSGGARPPGILFGIDQDTQLIVNGKPQLGTIDLKKDQGTPFFIQGCKDVYDKKKKLKGISCLAKASLAGGSAFINYT